MPSTDRWRHKHYANRARNDKNGFLGIDFGTDLPHSESATVRMQTQWHPHESFKYSQEFLWRSTPRMKCPCRRANRMQNYFPCLDQVFHDTKTHSLVDPVREYAEACTEATAQVHVMMENKCQKQPIYYIWLAVTAPTKAKSY